MRLTSRLSLARNPAPTVDDPPRQSARSGFFAFLRRNMTRKLAAALAIWRIEARTATPLAILLVATLGRWTGALVDGAIMACFAALFLFLLDGQRAVDDVRGWARERRFTRRYLLPIAEDRGRRGTVRRALALPASIMLLGPFWRALTYHLFRLPRLPAYVLSVGGSIPHSMFWTGIVAASLWEIALQPALRAFWESALHPVLRAII